jgi:hypothetical protein
MQTLPILCASVALTLVNLSFAIAQSPRFTLVPGTKLISAAGPWLAIGTAALPPVTPSGMPKAALLRIGKGTDFQNPFTVADSVPIAEVSAGPSLLSDPYLALPLHICEKQTLNDTLNRSDPLSPDCACICLSGSTWSPEAYESNPSHIMEHSGPVGTTGMISGDRASGCLTIGNNCMMLSSTAPGPSQVNMQPVPTARNISSLKKIIDCATFTGDTAAQLNACNAAVIAQGGGWMDASALDGARAMLAQVNIGSTAAHNAGISVGLLLPISATWTWGLTDGISSGLYQFGNTTILGQSNGGSQRMLLGCAPGTSMGSLYTTDANPTEGGSYIRAEGFEADNNCNGDFANGMMQTRKIFDSSHWSNMKAINTNGDAWHIDGACCGADYSNINGGTLGGASGGVALKIGDGYAFLNASVTRGSLTVISTHATLTSTYLGAQVSGPNIPSGAVVATIVNGNTFTLNPGHAATATASGLTLDLLNATNGSVKRFAIHNSSFNSPGTGLPNIMITSGLGTSSGTLDNVYEERNTGDLTAPFIYQDQDISDMLYTGVHCDDNIAAYCLENHSTLNFTVLAMKTSHGIDDVANGVVITPTGTLGGLTQWAGIEQYSHNAAYFPTLILPMIRNASALATDAQGKVIPARGAGTGYSLGGPLTTANVVLATGTNSGAGDGATLSVFGLDASHKVVLVTGTKPTPGRIIWTTTYTVVRGHDSYCTAYPADNNDATSQLRPDQIPKMGTTSDSMYIFYAGATPLPAKTKLAWNITCP